MILEKKIQTNSIIAAQKDQKKLLTEIFSIFECLVTQNPSNQDSQLT